MKSRYDNKTRIPLRVRRTRQSRYRRLAKVHRRWSARWRKWARSGAGTFVTIDDGALLHVAVDVGFHVIGFVSVQTTIWPYHVFIRVDVPIREGAYEPKRRRQMGEPSAWTRLDGCWGPFPEARAEGA